MARRTVWIPDELDEMVRDRLPGVNLSRLVAGALSELLGCDHERLGCLDCGEPVDAAVLRLEALGTFWRDLSWSVEGLVHQCGTAEGAYRVMAEVGQRHGVPGAGGPLPRPTARERARAAG